MMDAAALPKGLAAVLQHTLLPKLSLAGLQACAQTCSELRQAVMEAPWGVWRSAWNQAGMPPDNLTGSTDPSSNLSRLARQHAAIKAGPTGVRTIQGSTSHENLAPTFTALQPDFAQLVSLCGRDVVSTPMDRTSDIGYAKCSAGTGSTKENFHALWHAEKLSSPDGNFLVALSYPGLSLYACQPTLQLINRVKLAGDMIVDWAPNSKQFSFFTTSKVFVVSMPGHGGRAAEMHVVAKLRVMDCMWSPCSSYIAVTTWIDEATFRSRLILCARQGTVLSRQTGLDTGYRALPWVQLDGKLSVAFTGRIGPQPGEKLWLQDFGASEPRGGFPADESWLQLGYRISGGHRVSDVKNMRLLNLTTEGLSCPDKIASTLGRCSGLATWAPGNSIWLALLRVKVEVLKSFHIIEGEEVQDCIHTAYLLVIDGRSGCAAAEVVVLETSFELESQSLMWSSSGSGLLIGLEIAPDPELASGDHKTLWMKRYYRFQ